MRKRNKAPHWFKLDNAAKIFPPTSSKRDTKVFRFACELKETIEMDVLQMAVNQALEQFPLYTSTLKRGLFWYYLETSDLKAVVQKEVLPICSPLYDRNKKTLLFRVSYYEKRINLEVYHALTDGTGALQFLKTIVYHYLILKYPGVFPEEQLDLDYDASNMEKLDDSFQKYYRKTKRKRQKGPSAYRVTGAKLSEYRLRIIEGNFSVQKTLELAHQYHTTMTIFLSAVLIQAIHETRKIKDYDHPIVLTIPVNLRKYFPSESARNFFGVINVGIHYDQEKKNFEMLIEELKKQFESELTREQLELRMNSLAGLEHNLFARLAPLFFKDWVLKLATSITDRDSTISFSNVGVIKMPKEMVPYVRLFDVFSSTNRIQACMCSFEDQLVMSFTSPFVSTDIPKNFFRILTKLGMDVEITNNVVDEE